MSNVKSLFGGPSGAPEPNERCIALLEEWLEMAKAGEIVGVAMAGLCRDNCARNALAGMVGGYSMIGALETAKAELIDVQRGGGVEVEPG